MTITYEVGNSLYVNLTNRCTNNCDFCVRTQSDGYYGDLWLDREPTVEEAVEDIKKRDLSKYNELVFCGYGEPTMRLYDLLDICRFVKSISKIPIRINTNGLANLDYNTDVTPLFKGLIDIVSISLNTANAEDYEKICHPVFGIKAYEGLLTFAEKAKYHVKRVILSVVDKTISDEDIKKCRDIAEKIGVELRIRDYID